MTQGERFSFRLDDDERRQLSAVARWLERTDSDALRWLIRQAYRELEAGLEKKQAAQGGDHVYRMAR